MPTWVLSELCKLVFNFFWKGKRDLVARSVVVQPTFAGGFNVVDVKLKVWSLVVQWVRRFSISPSSGWVSFMSYWFRSVFGATPLDVLSSPFSFNPRALPSFYCSLLFAWRAVDGAFSSSRSSFVMGSSSPHHLCLAAGMSTKFCYVYLLSEHQSTPHCVDKFFPSYGLLYWPTTWRQLSFFDLDRPVIDLNWRVAHGVLYTVDRLLSFGYQLNPSCFCGPVLETAEHLFFRCPLAQSVLSWLQTLMSSYSPSSPSLLCRHVLFGLNSNELRRVPRIFVYILHCCKFFVWLSRNDYRFRDVRPGAVDVIANVKARVAYHLPLFFKRFRSSRRRRYFHRQWGANGVVCSVADDCLSMCW